jgi:hypothetical protein
MFDCLTDWQLLLLLLLLLLLTYLRRRSIVTDAGLNVAYTSACER